jgi:single-strand DNA-binding protein
MSMNLCIFQGNLTRDVNLKYLPNGDAVAEVGIAVNQVWKAKDGTKKESVQFFDLEAWRATAEFLAKYFEKGKPILVTCKAKQEQWERDGVKHSRVKFTIEDIQFVGGGNGGGGKTGQQEDDQPKGGGNSPSPSSDDVPDDDVPF